MCVVDVKTAEQHFAHIGLAVAVSVLEEKNVRSLSDDQSAVGENHARRNAKLIGENGKFVSLPVAVRILGNDNAIMALAVRMLVVGIIDALGDESPTASIPGDGDG